MRQDDRLPVEPSDAAPPQRICGWCRMQIAPGTKPATYGICRRCFLQIELDATRREAERRKSTNDDPFYASDYTLTAPVSRPDERVWTRRREDVTWSCELHFRSESDAWEGQILRNGDVFVWQEFGSRELAQGWADATRQILEKGGA